MDAQHYGDAFPGESASAPAMTAPAMPNVAPQVPCSTCGSAGSSLVSSAAASQRAGHPWVYAFGRIEPRFPSVGVEKEFAQFASSSGRAGVDDAALMRSVLGEVEASYLARNLTWVLVALERDALVIIPRDGNELDLLIDASKANKADSLCLVIGRATVGGWWAPDIGEPGLPRYGADQIASFEDDFPKMVPRPDDVPEAEFQETVRSVFDRIRRRADNTGVHDDSRALNYMALRYGAMYEVAGRAAIRGIRLAGIDTSMQLAPDGRQHVMVRFRFRNVTGDLAETYSCRIDVTEQFPFIASPLQQVFDA